MVSFKESNVGILHQNLLSDVTMQVQLRDDLFEAVNMGDPHRTARLIQTGASINDINHTGDNILYFTAKQIAPRAKGKSGKKTGPKCGARPNLTKFRMCLKVLLLSGCNIRLGNETCDYLPDPWNVKVPEKCPLERLMTCSKPDIDSIHILYAAGCIPTTELLLSDNLKDYVQLILDDQMSMLPLKGLCRRKIRQHLMSLTKCKQHYSKSLEAPTCRVPSIQFPYKYSNLFVAVSVLPIPRSVKEFLLFDVNIMDVLTILVNCDM